LATNCWFISIESFTCFMLYFLLCLSLYAVIDFLRENEIYLFDIIFRGWRFGRRHHKNIDSSLDVDTLTPANKSKKTWRKLLSDRFFNKTKPLSPSEQLNTTDDNLSKFINRTSARTLVSRTTERNSERLSNLTASLDIESTTQFSGVNVRRVSRSTNDHQSEETENPNSSFTNRMKSGVSVTKIAREKSNVRENSRAKSSSHVNVSISSKPANKIEQTITKPASAGVTVVKLHKNS